MCKITLDDKCRYISKHQYTRVVLNSEHVSYQYEHSTDWKAYYRNWMPLLESTTISDYMSSEMRQKLYDQAIDAPMDTFTYKEQQSKDTSQPKTKPQPQSSTSEKQKKASKMPTFAKWSIGLVVGGFGLVVAYLVKNRA